MTLIAFPGPTDNRSVLRSLQQVQQREKQEDLPTPVRRRGSADQGRALETLGHAVEYLIDSRIFLAGELDPRPDQEAVQILMRASRAVFADCPEVVSLRRRLREWVAGHLIGETEARER